MPIRYHNIEEYNIKRAIFYGCSNTAGSELADADIFDMSLKEVNTLKMRYGRSNWNAQLYSKVDTMLDPRCSELAIDRYVKLCNQYSYAKHLSDMLSTEYVNFAEPGTSQKKILFNILSDIANGYYKDGDVVFIGATSPVRDMIIDEEGNLHNFIMSHRHTLKKLETLYDALIQINNEYQVALNNMIILRSIQTVLHQENIPHIFIETHPYIPYPDDPSSQHSNLKFLKTKTDIDLIKRLKTIYKDTFDRLNFVPVGSMYKYKGERCAYGHAGIEAHKMFATEIYDYLIKPK